MNNLEEKITNAQSEEELLRVLADAGMPITSAQLHAAVETGNGEMTEDALEAVSGGCILPWLIIRAWYNRRSGHGGSFSGGGGFGGGGGGGGSR